MRFIFTRSRILDVTFVRELGDDVRHYLKTPNLTLPFLQESDLPPLQDGDADPDIPDLEDYDTESPDESDESDESGDGDGDGFGVSDGGEVEPEPSQPEIPQNSVPDEKERLKNFWKRYV